MAPRAVGTGTIAFGLVNIPVKLYSAANPSAAISFKLLSKEGHKLKQQYIDPQNEDKVVARTEMVKGYEFAKDQYVIFSEPELKELQEKATQTIEIAEFVPEAKVPKVYYDKTYYLGPDKGGDRAYKLLSEAMRRSGRVGLARYAARGKMYLVLVSPQDDGLVMYQLHYADEVQPFSEVPRGDAEVKEAELGLALQLIDQISSESFRPDKYDDEVRRRVEAAIQRKIEGQDITEAAEEQPKAQIIDIMAALKASLGVGGGEVSAPAAAAEGDADEGRAPAQAASKKRAPRKKAESS
jgi:DNA end-binding protein Ku